MTCGFVDRSVIVVVTLCLILIGALAYYFNSRIANLERSIVKQNHVLTDFITNVKSNMVLSSGEEKPIVVVPPPVEICKPVQPPEKIGVSDSEGSSSCDTDDTACNDIKVNDTMTRTLSMATGGLDMKGFDVVILQMGHHETPPGPSIVELSEQHNEPTLIKLGDLETVEQLDKLSTGSMGGSHTDDNESGTINTSGTSIDFKKMKLTQLKDIASSKGIDIKGKKKNELVETLTKQ